MKIREVIAYKNYFEDFLLGQPRKVQDKIFKIIEAIETLERVPSNYLKAMEGTNGLYEARIQLASNIWRVFCFFDNGNVASNEGILPRKKQIIMETKSWKDIKDNVYGVKGTDRRDELERDFEGFKIGLQLKKAREDKHLTQTELGELILKKREYISRIENNGSNLTLKTLYDIVEKGLG
eukprot:gene18298-25756_t